MGIPDNVCSLAFIFLTLSFREEKKKYAKLCFNLDTPWTAIKYILTPKTKIGNFKNIYESLKSYLFIYVLFIKIS